MDVWLCEHCSKEFDSELEAVNHEKDCLKDILAKEKEKQHKQKQKEALLKKNEEEQTKITEEMNKLDTDKQNEDIQAKQKIEWKKQISIKARKTTT